MASYPPPPVSYPYSGGPPSIQPHFYGGSYMAPPAAAGHPYVAPSSAPPYGASPPSSLPYGAPPSAPYGAAGECGSLFAALVPSVFPPGTDLSMVACFQAADRDGSGMIDDRELQSALSGYNQSFSLRTVHLLMYLFTNTNLRRISMP